MNIVDKKNCRPTPNKNPVINLTILFDSRYWSACSDPSIHNGKSNRTDQINSI
jgi:hypothetical protein